MTFFRRAVARMRSEPSEREDPSLVEDPFYLDQPAREWADRLTAGDDHGFRAYLAAEPDPERRDFTIETVLAATDPRADWVKRWVQEQPDDPLANLVLARHLVHSAWDARTARAVGEVNADRLNQFFARLELSWSAYQRVIELDPDEPSTYAQAIDCAKGLELEKAEGFALYDAAQARRPWQHMAHQSMVQFLSPKWGGSRTAMFEFARQVSSDAPVGSTVHGVLVDAHVEMWLEDGDRYWADARVRDEVLVAASRSVGSATLTDSPWVPRVRSAFAFAFWKLGELERAREQFQQIGPLVARPFDYLDSPRSVATRARREAGMTPGPA